MDDLAEPFDDASDYVEAAEAAEIVYNAPDPESAEVALRASYDGVKLSHAADYVGVAVFVSWEQLDHGSDITIGSLPYTGDKIQTGGFDRFMLENLSIDTEIVEEIADGVGREK